MQLGEKTPLPNSPDEAKLECVANTSEFQFIARFTIPEFTSLCPVTGQPDFGRFTIDYIPDELLVESKSLKLFMGSFRNHGAFHEKCTNMIAEAIWEVACPRWLRVVGLWAPRGGISIDVFWEGGKFFEGKDKPPYPNLDFISR